MGIEATYIINEAVEAKLTYDTATRLNDVGLPLHPDNDYERHLYARKLRLEGYSRDEVRENIIALGLEDIPANKKYQYIEDLLDSVIVGLSDLPLPIHLEEE